MMYVEMKEAPGDPGASLLFRLATNSYRVHWENRCLD